MPEKNGKCHVVPVEQAAMGTIQRVPFHEDELDTVVDEQTGKAYVLPKRFCDIFRLSWSTQYAKLKRNKVFQKGIVKINIPSTSGEQETVLLELRLLHTWLLSISADRITPALQEKLLRYQDECADALHAYFTKGIAVNPRSALDHFPEMRATVQALEAAAEARLLAERATKAAHEATVLALQAVTTANVAIEDGKRMTIEEFVLKNGLLRQFPVAEWRSMANWLTAFCQAHALPVQKQPVPGKLWADENSYPLAAFGAWRQSYQRRWRQVPLVEEEVGTYGVPTV